MRRTLLVVARMSRTLLRASKPWQANNARKALAGMVSHELIDGVAYEFDPRVNYSEDSEPFPWLLVADQGEVLLDDGEPESCESCGRPL